MGNEGSKLECEVEISTPKLAGPCPSPRESAAGVALSDQQLLVFGGGGSSSEDEAQQYNDVHVLDVRTKTWRLVQTLGTPPCPRTGHTASLVCGKVVVFGGCSVSEGYLNDCHELDPVTWEWKEILACGPIPCRRDKHVAVAVGGAFYVWGGFGPEAEEEMPGAGEEGSEEEESDEEEEGEERDPNAAAQFTWFSNVYKLDLDTKQWTQPEVTGEAPSARAAHGACHLGGGTILVFGGRDSEGRQGDTFTLDTGAMAWKKHPDAGAPPARSFHGVAAMGGAAPAALCFGGIGASGDVFGAPLWAFDGRTGAWAEVATGGGKVPWPAARSACVVAVLGGGGGGGVAAGGGTTLAVFGGASDKPSATGAPCCLNDVTLADLGPVAAALDRAAADKAAKEKDAAGA